VVLPLNRFFSTSTIYQQQEHSFSDYFTEDRAKLFPIGANELKKTESIHYTIAEALRLAKLELEINKDSVQSSEKLWLASAMCVKQFAKEQMILLKSHKAIGACVDYIVEETLNTMIWTYFSSANGLHENIYEQTFSLSKVNHYAVSVEKFVFEIAHLQRTMESINFSLNGFPKFASEWPYRCSVKMVKDGGKKFVKIR